MIRKGFKKQSFITNVGCLPIAIAKDGRTLKQILTDIEKEKEIEERVLKMHSVTKYEPTIARRLNISLGKVQHIIKFDALGLSYRKVGKR